MSRQGREPEHEVGLLSPLDRGRKGGTPDKPFTGEFSGAEGSPADSAVVQVSEERAEPPGGTSCAQVAVGLVDGEGNIAGTRVEAHRIAALISGGMSAEGVLEDYPNLDGHQIDAAFRFAAANGVRDREYFGRTVKSVLRRGGGGLAAAFALSRRGERTAGEDAG